ncbi:MULTISPECIES: OmpA family protein [Arenibacter]|uniref:OmpA family protein n=1 Tax=Arenibacter TaxID=178469 RepID=UPI000A39A77C|nr:MULTISPECIES: OmpA family protein [Arenibacter]
MRKNIITALILLMTVTISYSQNRRELMQEVEDLESRLRETETTLSEVRRLERMSSAKVKSYEAQLEELRVTNNNLLQSLNNFTEASTKRSEYINSTLASLQKNEGQLRAISDALTSRDSVTFATLTLFKKNLGPDTKIAISKGAITISLDNAFLFGDPTKSNKVTPEGEAVISKIGSILKADPSLDITIVSNSNLVNNAQKKHDNWKISTQQAATIAYLLEDKYEVEAKRMLATGKSELGLYSIDTATEIIVQPKFYEFYNMVKENMK